MLYEVITAKAGLGVAAKQHRLGTALQLAAIDGVVILGEQTAYPAGVTTGIPRMLLRRQCGLQALLQLAAQEAPQAPFQALQGRITSYNVCYTKLLRNEKSALGAISKWVNPASYGRIR